MKQNMYCAIFFRIFSVNGMKKIFKVAVPSEEIDLEEKKLFLKFKTISFAKYSKINSRTGEKLLKYCSD